MNASQSLDHYALMRKLVEKEIDTYLLLEFYEEVVENEKVFCEMVEHISTRAEMEEREKSVEHIESFCTTIRKLQVQYEILLAVDEKIYITESAKRESMINNAARFLDLLEKDCNIQLP